MKRGEIRFKVKRESKKGRRGVGEGDEEEGVHEGIVKQRRMAGRGRVLTLPYPIMAGEGKNHLLGRFGQGGWGRRKNSQKDTEPEQAASGKGKGVLVFRVAWRKFIPSLQ